MVQLKKRKLGRGVAVVGAGMSKFGVHSDSTIRELFVEAYADMLKTVDRGIDPADIEGAWIGNCGAELWDSSISNAVPCADWIGLTPKPALKIEDACASASVALREAVMGIASGMYDIVIAGGSERMSTLSTEGTTTILASAADTLYESTAGFTFPGLYATIATAHMHKYGTTEEDLMWGAIKNHRNGALNRKAHFPNTIQEIMEKRIAKCKKDGKPVPTWSNEIEALNDPSFNPVIAWPMKLYDCCPTSDGATCVLLVAEDIAKNFTDKPVYVIGTSQTSGQPLHSRDTLTSIPAARLAAAQAYDMAEVKPEDIKIAEVHDCFTIAEVVGIADLGFFEEGKEAARAAREGKTARDGIKPINTSGGLKSKGHPVGASGVGQTVELFKQMRGEAGERQVPNMDVNLALNHNVGAHGTTVVVNVYERR